MRGTWPVSLRAGDVVLRPLRFRDGRAWHDVRRRNADWLQPWEATLPQPDPGTPTTFAAMVRQSNAQARAGRALPFGIFMRDAFVGQVTVGGIAGSSLRTCHIGYWIDQGHAGRGIVPLSVAVVGDYCFSALHLHRIEINIRPENSASLAVAAKLGFRDEGLRLRYLHIDGDWRDHQAFAITAEERPDGLQHWLRHR